MILAGDIGGTHSRFAFFDDRGFLVEKSEYLSKDHREFVHIVEQFLSDKKVKPSVACLGIAGPIREGICKATNLPWVIDARELERKTTLKKVRLINDLEANAWGIALLKEEEFCTLNVGDPKPGNAALISSGTGLGEAGLFWDGKAHIPFATEGGHCDFSARDEREMRLQNFLFKRFDHLSFERVLCGSAFLLLYEYLTHVENFEKNKKIETLGNKEDSARLITQEALEGKCPTCIEVMNWFSSIYGSESANLALKMLSFSGVYIGGGIAPKILPFLKKGFFMEAFLKKGRFKELLSSFPVKVIINDETALLGAMRYAKEKLL